MLFGLFLGSRQSPPTPYLAARTRLLDGSELLVHLEDVPLVFETCWGNFRVDLHRVSRLHNVATVVALREYLWANRFEIFCRDGNKIIGVPKSPQALQLHPDEHLPEHGQIKLCEIDWLIVKGECQGM